MGVHGAVHGSGRGVGGALDGRWRGGGGALLGSRRGGGWEALRGFRRLGSADSIVFAWVYRRAVRGGSGWSGARAVVGDGVGMLGRGVEAGLGMSSAGAWQFAGDDWQGLGFGSAGTRVFLAGRGIHEAGFWQVWGRFFGGSWDFTIVFTGFSVCWAEGGRCGVVRCGVTEGENQIYSIMLRRTQPLGMVLE